MSGPPVTVQLEPAPPQDNGLSTGAVIAGGSALALAAAVIASILAALLHRFARRAALGLRTAIAGLVPLLIVLALLAYAFSQSSGFSAWTFVRSLLALPTRGHLVLIILTGVGLASAFLISRFLQRRFDRRQPAPIDTFS